MEGKIASDAAWTFAAYGVMAVGGIALNLLVGRAYGANGVGVFNQAMAAYVILAHASVAGLHNATLREVALAPAEAKAILLSAILACLVPAAATAAALYLGAGAIGALLDSPETGRAILWLVPSILLFALNKVGLAALNGLTLMRRYAVGQMIRYSGIAGTVALLCAAGGAVERLGAAFTVAELMVAAYLVAATAPARPSGAPGPTVRRMMALAAFGLRSAAAGLLAEINLRIDVLTVGIFLSDQEVGIYAFAALLVEGFANVAVVLRSLTNPYLARLIAKRQEAELRGLVRRIQALAYPLAILAFAAAWIGFQPVVRLLVGPGDLELALAPLLILIAMMTPYFGYSPFEDSLMLSGQGGVQSLYQLGITGLNVLFNLALVPLVGLNGAAVATGLAGMVACVALVALIRRATGLALVPWSAGAHIIVPPWRG